MIGMNKSLVPSDIVPKFVLTMYYNKEFFFSDSVI